MLTDIYEALEIVIKELYEYSDAYEPRIETYNGDKISISNKYSKMTRNIQTVSQKDNTMFLAIPIIQDFINDIKPFYRVSLEDVINGRAAEKAKHIVDLEEALKTSDVNYKWASLKEEIGKNILSMKLPYNEAEMDKMVYVFPAIQDALLFLEKNETEIMKIQSGKKGTEICKAVPYITMHTTVSDFASMLKAVDKDCVITFGAVFETFGYTEDVLGAYLRGHDSDERISNFSRNLKTTKDIVRQKVSSYDCKIVIGIKNGENIWVLPIKVANQYGKLDNYEDFFEYGERRTFLPLQVFFEDIPPGEYDSTELMVRKKGYWLKNIIDCHQSVWTVTLFSEIKKMFFSMDRDEEKITVFGDSMNVNVKQVLEGSVSEVDKNIHFPSLCEEKIFIDFDELIADETDRELAQLLHVTAEDLIDTPLYTNEYGTYESLQSTLEERGKAILARILASKLAEAYVKEIDENFSNYRAVINGRKEQIVRLMQERTPALAPNTIIYENKKPCYKLDGTYIYQYGNKVISSIGVHEGRNAHIFIPESLKGKCPPVYAAIRPVDIQGIRLLLGKEENGLPEVLKYYEFLNGTKERNDFPKKSSLVYSEVFKNHMNRYFEISKNKKKFHAFNVNICFGKKEFKAQVGIPELKEKEVEQWNIDSEKI